ncbi:MAG TPA: dihydrofolate reductase [Urbifossiella sp.]|nr:dihydrofolate reductase [Urbifossiella sp.]
MRLALIAALGRNHVIGTDTGLPWHLPRDLKHFRALTLGKPIILGRTTFEQIGRPLPDRPNIVLTRRPSFAADGVVVARSAAEAMELAERLGADEAVVIGGGEVYREFLPRADRLYLTVVDGDFEGTTTFPVEALAGLSFAVTDVQRHPADAKNAHAVTFWQLDRSADAPPGAFVMEVLG